MAFSSTATSTRGGGGAAGTGRGRGGRGSRGSRGGARGSARGGGSTTIGTSSAGTRAVPLEGNSVFGSPSTAGVLGTSRPSLTQYPPSRSALEQQPPGQRKRPGSVFRAESDDGDDREEEESGLSDLDNNGVSGISSNNNSALRRGIVRRRDTENTTTVYMPNGFGKRKVVQYTDNPSPRQGIPSAALLREKFSSFPKKPLHSSSDESESDSDSDSEKESKKNAPPLASKKPLSKRDEKVKEEVLSDHSENDSDLDFDDEKNEKALSTLNVSQNNKPGDLFYYDPTETNKKKPVFPPARRTLVAATGKPLVSKPPAPPLSFQQSQQQDKKTAEITPTRLQDSKLPEATPNSSARESTNTVRAANVPAPHAQPTTGLKKLDTAFLQQINEEARRKNILQNKKPNDSGILTMETPNSAAAATATTPAVVLAASKPPSASLPEKPQPTIQASNVEPSWMQATRVFEREMINQCRCQSGLLQDLLDQNRQHNEDVAGIKTTLEQMSTMLARYFEHSEQKSQEMFALLQNITDNLFEIKKANHFSNKLAAQQQQQHQHQRNFDTISPPSASASTSSSSWASPPRDDVNEIKQNSSQTSLSTSVSGGGGMIGTLANSLSMTQDASPAGQMFASIFKLVARELNREK